MKKILLMTISPTGFIARENDEAPWSPEEFARCVEFVREHGNLIVGHKTYDLMRNGSDFDPSVQTIVLSKTPQKSEGNVTFVSSPEEALSVLTQKGFDVAVIGGGSVTNALFLAGGLIDELVFDVEPLLFGGGLPVFKEIPGDIRLELAATKQFGNTVQLWYRVQK